MFYRFSFFTFIFTIFSFVVFANLDAEPFSDIDGFHLNIIQTGAGDTATLKFSSEFDEIFDDSIIIDGISIQIDAPNDFTPTHLEFINYTDAVLFDNTTLTPVGSQSSWFVDMGDFNRGVFTFYDFELGNEDKQLFDLIFEYNDFQFHEINIEAEVLTEDEKTYPLRIIDFPMVPLDTYTGNVVDINGNPISDVTIMALGVKDIDDKIYSTSTDEAGDFLISIPRNLIDNAFYDFMATKSNYITNNFTPTSLTGNNIVMEESVVDVSGVLLGLDGDEVKEVDVFAYYLDDSGLKPLVKVIGRQSIIVPALNTVYTFSLGFTEEELIDNQIFMGVALRAGYEPIVVNLNDLSEDVLGVVFDFTGREINIVADTDAAKTAAMFGMTNLFAGLENAAEMLAELNSAMAAIISPPIPIDQGMKLEFSDYLEEDMDLDILYALQKVSIEIPPLSIDGGTTMQPVIHIPKFSDLSVENTLKLGAVPIGFNLLINTDSGGIISRNDLNAALEAAYDAGNPLILEVPRGDITALDLMQGNKVIRYADFLNDLVDESSDTFAYISPEDVIDPGLLTGKVQYKVRHLTTFSGGDLPDEEDYDSGEDEDEDEDEVEEEEEDDDDDSTSSSSGGGGSGSGFVYTPLEEEVYEDLCPEIEELLLEHPFVDIDGHYAEGYISGLYSIGAVHGMDASEYYMPDENSTRVELLKMSLETLGYDVDKYEPQQIFSDMNIESWYSKYLYIAYIDGIVEGYSDGTFKPGKSVTRAEALKMFLVAGEFDLYSLEESPFTDVDDDSWYKEVVETGYDIGIIEGYGDGTFGPNDPITRGQAAIMMLRLECTLSEYFYTPTI